MALINCPECGREVSDQAEACPRCAYPIAKKLAAAAAGLPSAEEAGPDSDSERDPEEGGDVLAPAERPGYEAAEGGDETLWQGGPSQWINARTFAGSLLVLAVIVALALYLRWQLNLPEIYWGLLLAVMPLLLSAWRWLQVACHRYEVDGERITVRTGVFSRSDDSIELYRVKDVTLHRPLVMRLCGLGNVSVVSSDKSMPEFTFYAVRGAAELADLLRKRAEERRVARGVRELDME